MKNLKKIPLLFFLFGFFSCSTTTDKDLHVHIEAGEFDRHNSIITFMVPDTMSREKPFQLVDPQGNTFPVQIENRQARFILPALNAGGSATLRLVPSDDGNGRNVFAELHQDAVSFNLDANRPVLQYRSGPGGLDLEGLDKRLYRGGYLHPVISPSGQVVTEHYNPDRPHQQGIWSGWSRTDFEGRNPGFWYGPTGTGSVDFHSVDLIWSGPVHGGIRAEHHYIDKTTEEPAVILSESWIVRVYHIPAMGELPVHLFELDVTQTNITESPFIINEWVYGGIGFRGNDSWLGEENTRLLTSEGKTRTDGEPLREIWSHVESHQSRARWAYLSGVTGDERSGIAILGHPDNLQFPEPIFMNLREPFFMFSPAVMGDIILDSGEALRFRYRYVVMDDDPDFEFLESLWYDFAYPPTVKLN